MRKKVWLLRILTGTMLCALVAGAFADVPINYDNARAAMQRKDWETANYEWRHILELDPQNLEASLGLAESLFNAGFYQEATGLLEAIPAKRRTTLVDIALARTYAATKQYVKSAQVYVNLLNKNPFLASAVQELEALEPHLDSQDRKLIITKTNNIANLSKTRAENAIKAGNFKAAAAYYEIVANHYHTVGLVNDYGLALLLAGEYQKAHDQFALLKTKGKLRFSQVNSNAAIASLSIGNYAEAKQEIAEAINAADGSQLKAKLYNNLGYIMEMSSKRQDAKFAYQHALTLNPAMHTAQLNLAFVQQEDREYADAVTNYEEILKKNPNNPEVWNRLGFVYELQYKAKPAMKAYERAMEIDPKYKDSYYNLSTLYKKMGKVKDANETLRKLAEMNYAELESKTPSKHKTPLQNNNPLKYVVLFPSNPHVIASIQ
jgi:tetratricopeptide (TPR) repeat protein